MLQSERDAEKYYQAQAKFEQRQRMIDKGWGDVEEHKKLEKWQRKQKLIKGINQFLLGGLMALFICLVVFGTNYLINGHAI
jgi:hypothetical protein